LLDLGRSLFGTQTLWAYALVFTIESILMLSAVMLLNKVNVAEFRDRTQTAISTVLAQTLDN
jgi:MFS transporter, BCD family, chlorophyll transporter